MKLFSIIILTIISYCNLYSQSSEEVKYTKGEIYTIVTDSKTKEVVSEKPFGKVVEITYNTFYKSFHFFMRTEEGVKPYKLNFVKKEDSGIQIMKDNKNNTCFVLDDIQNTGKLRIITGEKDGYLVVLEFRNVE